MNAKKKARQRGEQVVFFFDPETKLFHDWEKYGNQAGQPFEITMQEFEKSGKDKLYLEVDDEWTPPPVIIPSKEQFAKAKAITSGEKNEKKVLQDSSQSIDNSKLEIVQRVSDQQVQSIETREELSEKAFRSTLRKIARAQGSDDKMDWLVANAYKDLTLLLFPELQTEIENELSQNS